MNQCVLLLLLTVLFRSSVSYVTDPEDPLDKPVVEPPVAPVAKPHYVVMLVLKTIDTSFDCQNTATLFQRFSNIAQTDTVMPMLSQIECPREVDETVSGSHYVLLQLNYEADSLHKYIFYKKMDPEQAVLSVLTPQLQTDESIQIVSVRAPATSFQYEIKLDGFLAMNKKRVNWSSDLLIDVKATGDQYKSLVTSVESMVKQNKDMEEANDFKLAYFYKQNDMIKVVLYFKNYEWVEETKIRKQLKTRKETYYIAKPELAITVVQGKWNPLYIENPEVIGYSSE